MKTNQEVHLRGPYRTAATSPNGRCGSGAEEKAMTANLGNKNGTKVLFLLPGATAAHGGGAILFLRSKSFSPPPSGTRMFSMCSIFAVIAASAAPVPH